MNHVDPQVRPFRAPRPTAEQLVLAQRIEEASLNAWPALQQQFYDGWVLRFARGFTKRANSVVPLYPSVQTGELALARKVRYCENLYAREGLQTVFRLTSISPDPDLDALLAARNYSQLDPTAVMALSLSAPQEAQPAAPEHSSNSVRFTTAGLDEWLDHYSALAAVPEAAKRLHRAILAGIQGYCGYGLLHANLAGKETVVACGLAVCESNYVGLFDIITHKGQRQQGFGKKLVNSLLAWSQRTAEADVAYLQMIATNGPADALYRGLGFAPLYHYWYRAK